MSVRAILLGPQRHLPTVRPAVDRLLGDRPDGCAGGDSATGDSVTGAIALVSAGWEEREAEDAEFREHLDRPLLNLEVWGRIERIFERDPELLQAMRHRHDTLRRVMDLYQLRLAGLLEPATELLRRAGESALLDPEREAAIAMLQTLDREHCQRVAAVHAEFYARWRPLERDAVAEQRRELDRLLQGASCLCLAGGHVGVLLHRLQLFELLALWGDKPIVAWSAGAMVLCDQVVLFHQEHGRGLHTQVMEAGCSVLPGLVPLPHARKRLDLHDRHGVQLMARRFAPAMCVPLDAGQSVEWDGARWSMPAGTRRLTSAGLVQEASV